MRDASTNSSVWKIILRRICVENSIFLPSAILNNMPLLELEHAATGPSRFISHVRNLSSGGMIKSYSKHYLSTSLRVLDNPQNDDEEISHIYLIPGGQFLISHHVSQLRMWDIGPPGTNWGPTPFLSPLAILNRYCKNAYVAHSTRDGEGLIILACTSDPWDIMDRCVNSQVSLTGSIWINDITFPVNVNFPSSRYIPRRPRLRSGRLPAILHGSNQETMNNTV